MCKTAYDLACKLTLYLQELCPEKTPVLDLIGTTAPDPLDLPHQEEKRTLWECPLALHPFMPQSGEWAILHPAASLILWGNKPALQDPAPQPHLWRCYRFRIRKEQEPGWVARLQVEGPEWESTAAAAHTSSTRASLADDTIGWWQAALETEGRISPGWRVFPQGSWYREGRRLATESRGNQVMPDHSLGGRGKRGGKWQGVRREIRWLLPRLAQAGPKGRQARAGGRV